MDNELLEKWSDLLLEWTNICLSYEEVERITKYFQEHKKDVIKEIQKL